MALKRNEAEREKICKKICSDIIKTDLTVDSICAKNGLSRHTYFVWKSKYENIAIAYKKAQSMRKKRIVVELKELAVMQLKRTMVDRIMEVKTQTVDKEGKVIDLVSQKIIPASITSIIFALANSHTNFNRWTRRDFEPPKAVELSTGVLNNFGDFCVKLEKGMLSAAMFRVCCETLGITPERIDAAINAAQIASVNENVEFEKSKSKLIDEKHKYHDSIETAPIINPETL